MNNDIYINGNLVNLPKYLNTLRERALENPMASSCMVIDPMEACDLTITVIYIGDKYKIPDPETVDTPAVNAVKFTSLMHHQIVEINDTEQLNIVLSKFDEKIFYVAITAMKWVEQFKHSNVVDVDGNKAILFMHNEGTFLLSLEIVSSTAESQEAVLN